MKRSAGSAASAALKRATWTCGDAVCRELLELAAQGGQARRRGAGCEKFARMRIEGQDGRRQRQIFRSLRQPGEHRLVAAMDAVEVADGQRDGAVAVGGIREPTK